MKLSVPTNLYGAKSLEETLQIPTSMDIHTVELGAGGYPGKAHCNPEELLADPAKYDAFMAPPQKYDVEVCALSAHGNAPAPQPGTGGTLRPGFPQCGSAGGKMGVDTVITFSGCPGDCEGIVPNWVPARGRRISCHSDWQWNRS